MKFLANENIPMGSVILLRQHGLDIMHVAEEAPSTKDTVIMRLAQEQNRIIITFDRDYGELIFKHHLPTPAGVVYLRFDPDYPTESGEIVFNLINSGSVKLDGKFTVISRANIRQRPLPQR